MFNIRAISVGLVALATVAFAMAQVDDEKTFYQLREDLATPAIKAQLVQLRSTIIAHGYHFTVGATSKIDADLKAITGYIKPPDFADQVAKHALALPAMLKARDLDDAQMKLKITGRIPLRVLPLTTLLPASFDWRLQNAVTMVKDQGQAGTCWACGSSAALESSELIRNSQYAFVSIQQAVTCSGGGTITGGSHGPVLDFFVSHGATYGDGGICPYLAIQGTAAQQTAWNALISTYYASAWDYIHANGGKATTVELKNAIMTHGPVVTAIDATDFNGYSGGVIDIPSTSSDHVVCIVGWDDSKGAFIVKNSWGHDWGSACGYGKEKGFCYVAYNDCNIGDAAAWVDAKIPSPYMPWYY